MQLTLPDNFWHYRRAGLIEHFMNLLDFGLLTSTVIHAPPATGKTAFIEQDLLPELAQQGYVPLVIRLDRQTDPTRTVLITLYRFITALVRKAHADFSFDETEAEMLMLPHSVTVMRRLFDLLTEYLHENDLGTLAVVIDNMDILGLDSRHDNLTYALRSFFDFNKSDAPRGSSLRQHRVLSFFVLSSQVAEGRLFYSHAEPFYHFGFRMEFPLLGDEFVRYLLEQQEALCGRRTDPTAALQMFDALERRPGDFRAVLLRSTLMVEPLEVAYAGWRADSSPQLAWRAQWAAMDAPVRQTFLNVLADSRFMRTDAMAGAKLEPAACSGQVRQQALRELLRIGLIGKLGRNHYSILDESFARWVALHRVNDAPDKA